MNQAKMLFFIFLVLYFLMYNAVMLMIWEAVHIPAGASLIMSILVYMMVIFPGSLISAHLSARFFVPEAEEQEE